jgi:hypothetical protein
MDEIRLAQADDIKQKDANWTAATTQYSQELAQHSADMSRYNAEIQTATSEWTSNNITYKVAKWNSLQGHKFTEFNNRVTDAMNKFNSDGAAYEKKWQEAVKKVDISGLNLSNELAIFDKQMSEYNGAVSSLTQEHQQNEILKKWEVYKFDSQQAISNFNAEVSSNMNTFNEQNTVLSTELTIAQANASNEQAALSAKMSASTELAKNNEAQRLAQELQTWQQELATFTNELNRYSTEASTEISKFNTLLSSASNRMTDSMNKFNTSLQTFQSEQQSWEKLIGMLKQEYAESIGVMIQNKGE